MDLVQIYTINSPIDGHIAVVYKELYNILITVFHGMVQSFIRSDFDAPTMGSNSFWYKVTHCLSDASLVGSF